MPDISLVCIPSVGWKGRQPSGRSDFPEDKFLSQRLKRVKRLRNNSPASLRARTRPVYLEQLRLLPLRAEPATNSLVSRALVSARFPWPEVAEAPVLRKIRSTIMQLLIPGILW
jgi:hypothetical protein